MCFLKTDKSWIDYGLTNRNWPVGNIDGPCNNRFRAKIQTILIYTTCIWYSAASIEQQARNVETA